MSQNTPDTLVLDIIAEKKKEKQIKINSFDFLTSFKSLNDWVISLSSVSIKDKLLFFQLMGAMIGAGMPIIDSLDLLKNQIKNPKFKMILADIKNSIENGSSLAESMRSNLDVFDEATCSVVEAGERSGQLHEIFKELMHQYEKINYLGNQIKSVLTYPVVVLFVMLLLTIIVLVFVVPQLEDLFGGSDNLPLPTRIMIGGSDFIIQKWPLVLFFFIVSIGSFLWWKKTKWGNAIWSIIIINAPISGIILRQMILTKVTKILGFLIKSGVPVIESLRITSHIAANPLYSNKLLLAADDISKGISIAENLSDNEKLFPPMLISLIAVGEKTATLDVVMTKISSFYEEELDIKVKMISKLMEPVIIIIMALGAVFLILAIYLPILKMNDQVTG